MIFKRLKGLFGYDSKTDPPPPPPAPPAPQTPQPPPPAESQEVDNFFGSKPESDESVDSFFGDASESPPAAPRPAPPAPTARPTPGRKIPLARRSPQPQAPPAETKPAPSAPPAPTPKKLSVRPRQPVQPAETAPPPSPTPSAPPPPAPDPNTVTVPLAEVLRALDAACLAGDPDQLAAQFPGHAVGFGRNEVMHGLSIGQLTFSAAALAGKLPDGILASDDAGVEIEVPLQIVVPLIPPPWFAANNQSTQKIDVVNQMDDLFSDLSGPSSPAPAAPSEPAPLPPAPAPAEASPAPVAAPPPEPVAEPPPTTAPQAVSGDQLNVPAGKVIGTVPDELLATPKAELATRVDLVVGFSRDELLASLAHGTIELTYGDLAQRTSDGVFGPAVEAVANDTLDVPIAEIVPLIPPAWFAIANQSMAKEEVVATMDNLFNDLEGDRSAPEAQPEAATAAPVPEAPPSPKPSAQPLAEAVAPPKPTSTPSPASEPAAPPLAPAPVPKSQNGTRPKPAPVAPPQSTPPPPTAPPAPEPASPPIAAEASLDTTAAISAALFGPVPPVAPAQSSVPRPVGWRSSAPNAINVNFATHAELTRLTGSSELSEAISNLCRSRQGIDSMMELMEIDGMTDAHYRRLSGGLEPGVEVWAAEAAINEMLGQSGQDVDVRQLTQHVIEKFSLDAVYVSSSDGMMLAGNTQLTELEKLKDGLVAVAPQLCLRLEKTLAQANLPAAPVITIPFANRAVTFGGTGQAYLVFVHQTSFPAADEVAGCRSICAALSWYYAERGVC